MFEKVSERLGVNIDKVILHKDETEKCKLKRALKKEIFKEKTRIAMIKRSNQENYEALKRLDDQYAV
ncbi:hypothetical protein [Peribacillus loiseleuriae]|uniref:Uncharacterized protein n=1 Tax=Peribacillus loiseleuriae TaxID=1679170 RepID=A0A0K9GSF0_9BACI|nr:hypothetical protein [Peribacillus loiseleuriae]KMY49614.1 hypothetical protein AC625_08720 [Peribacillus loiseleuriae]